MGYFGVLKRCVSSSSQAARYWAPGGYDVEKYWRHRLHKYGFNLSGVGNINLSHDENKQIYLKAKKVFLSLCYKEGIDFKNIYMLNVGCGTGFYAEIFRENGGKRYLGIDITDILFGKLKQIFPEFQFRKSDISTQELEAQFDLIIMIDVVQHITNDDKFSFAMQNIRSHLSANGIFIVTSWLNDKARHSFYEVSRSMDAFKKEFPSYAFSEPTPFKNKFIFSIKKSK